MKIIVTAGPTREYIDDVRFISNPSTGRMGYAVAEAAVLAGHEVVLISGPVAMPPPEGVLLVHVESAVEMRDAVQQAFGDCDCLVMTAAVGDYRPAKRFRGKMKKSLDKLSLDLVRNPDILAEMGRQKADRLLIGFALESDNAEQNARKKLESKDLDYIVLNSPAAFGAEEADVTILGCHGERQVLQGVSKAEIAREIMRIAEKAATREQQARREVGRTESQGKMKQVTLQIRQKQGCEDVPLPQYMSEGASGMDVCAAVEEDVTVSPGDVRLIPTGIFVAVEPGFEVQVRPRSGLALKHGITIVNSPGTIDSDYRGEVGIILGNMGRQPFVVTRGMRIAQLVVQQVARAEIQVKQELDDTARSSGGFGHTGR